MPVPLPPGSGGLTGRNACATIPNTPFDLAEAIGDWRSWLEEKEEEEGEEPAMAGMRRAHGPPSVSLSFLEKVERLLGLTVRPRNP